ncbi:MAG: hypothetical protein IKU19_00945 [Clostridia bacterium]|nr:hypothetical protein [Clostridia bacterium]
MIKSDTRNGVVPGEENYKYFKFLILMEYDRNKEDLISNFESFLETFKSTSEDSLARSFHKFKEVIDKNHTETETGDKKYIMSDSYKGCLQQDILSKLTDITKSPFDTETVIRISAMLILELFVISYRYDGALCQKADISEIYLESDLYKKYCMTAPFLNSKEYNFLLERDGVKDLFLTGAFYWNDSDGCVCELPGVKIIPRDISVEGGFPYDFWTDKYEDTYAFFKEVLVSLRNKLVSCLENNDYTEAGKLFCVPGYFGYLIETAPEDIRTVLSKGKRAEIFRLLTETVSLSHYFNGYKKHVDTSIDRYKHIYHMLKYQPFPASVNNAIRNSIGNHNSIVPLLYYDMVRLMDEEGNGIDADLRYVLIKDACDKAIPELESFREYGKIISMYCCLCKAIAYCCKKAKEDCGYALCIKYDFALPYKNIINKIEALKAKTEDIDILEQINTVNILYEEHFSVYNTDGSPTQERREFITSSDIPKEFAKSVNILKRVGIEKGDFMRPYYIADLDSLMCSKKGHTPIDIQPLLMKLLLSGQRIVVSMPQAADNPRFLELCGDPGFLSLIRSGHIILSFFGDYSSIVNWAADSMQNPEFEWSSMGFLNLQDIKEERSNIAQYLRGKKQLSIDGEYRSAIENFKEKLNLIDENLISSHCCLFYQRKGTGGVGINELFKMYMDEYFEVYTPYSNDLLETFDAHRSVEEIIKRDYDKYTRSTYNKAITKLSKEFSSQRIKLGDIMNDRYNEVIGNRVSDYRIHRPQYSFYIPEYKYNGEEFKVYDEVSRCMAKHSVGWDDIPEKVYEIEHKLKENQTVDSLAAALDERENSLLNYAAEDGVLVIDNTYLQLSSKEEVKLNSSVNNKEEKGRLNVHTNIHKKG